MAKTGMKKKISNGVNGWETEVSDYDEYLWY